MAGKKKRGNSEGSIRLRSDGRWESRYVDLTGVRRSIMGRTRLEVADKLGDALQDRKKGVASATDNRLTVAQYLALWHETMRPPRVRESTWIRNETHIRLWITPIIGKIHLSKLNRMDLQKLYAKCSAAGLSSTTVNHLHGVMHHALKDAMLSDILPRNVADLIKPPSVTKRELQVLTPEQVDTLLAFAEVDGSQLAPMIALTVATALRAGELLALRWARVDLNRRVLHVRDNRTRTATGYTDGAPKTASSARDIKLVSMTLDALRAHRAHQAEYRLMLGDRWVDEDRIFPSSSGTAMDASNLRKQWLKLLNRAGLSPDIHFHDLRHSAASWLLAQGVPITDVSKMLGHADPSVTLRIYAHAMPDSQDRVLAAMEFLLATRKAPASDTPNSTQNSTNKEAAQDAQKGPF